jgi:DNA-binding XRE family transcriptional regulator
MIEHTETQIIEYGGKPAFAVIPWEEYQRLINNQMDPDEADVEFPHDVVAANVMGDSLIKAWREYLGLTQEELATKAGIQQPALARMEKPDARPRTGTLKKLAEAMGISVEQLRD